MKWIGQHIWDFISRFRTTVYLENLETSSDENVLVVDSDGKVTKNTSLGGADLTYNGSTANGMLTYGGASVIDVESTLTYSPNNFLLQTWAPTTTFSGFHQAATPTTDWQTGSKSGSGFFTSLDMDRNTASGQTNYFTAFKGTIDDDGTHVGTIDYMGLDLSVDFANTNGTQKVRGINTLITDCDTADLYGIHQQIEDGGKDLYFLSSNTTTVDYFSLAVGESGETTITTVDGGGAAAHLNFTVDGGINFNSEDVLFTSSTASEPVVEIRNTADDDTAPTLKFNNTRGGSDAQDSDDLGFITFWGNDDGTPSTQQYARIYGLIHDATSTEESGQLNFDVACHDGGLGTGLILRGGSVDGEVDAWLGTGAASLTTITGDLMLQGDDLFSTGALKITPGGGASVSGLAFHIDANAGTDNEVQIDAGLLDINVTDDITIDAADNIALTTAGTDADGKISLVSGVASDNTAIHLDGNADAASIVDIDAGVLNIDSSGATTITAAGTAELAGSTVTLDSAGAVTFEAHGSATIGVGKTSGTLPVVDLVMWIFPGDFTKTNDHAGSRYTTEIENDGSNFGISVTHTNLRIIAHKQIPKGFKVTKVYAYSGTTTSTNIRVHQIDPTDGTLGIGLANGTFNVEHTLSSAITSADDAILHIDCGFAAAADILYSVKVTLEEV